MQKLDRLTATEFLDPATSIRIMNRVFTDNISVHWHEYYELEYVSSGSCTYSVNGQKYDITTDCLLFISPVDFHEFIIKAPIEVVNISFSEQCLENEIIDFLFKLPSCVINAPQLKPNISLIYEEYYSDFPLKWEMIHNQIEYILINYYRSVKLKYNNKNLANNQLRTPLQQAIAYIQTNFSEQITLQDISQHVSLCPNYFSQVFHELTGKSFLAYLSELRLTHAKKLLTL